MSSEARTLLGALDRFRDGMGETEAGFGGIIAMLSPDASANTSEEDIPDNILPEGMEAPSSAPPESSSTKVADIPPGDGNLAGKLLAAVVAIPALPTLPNLSGNFDALRDNELIATMLDQLSTLDTDGLNTTVDEFKSLLETTIQPGLDKAAEGGFEFILEPETIETVIRGATEFTKTIGGMNATVGGIVDKLTNLMDQFGN